MLGLSDAAFRAYFESVQYIAKYLTDGYVPEDALRGRQRACAPELLDVGMWKPNGGGYYVERWREHVPSALNVQTQRRAAQERMRKSRQRKGTPTEDGWT